MERVDKAFNWIGRNKRNLVATGVLLPSAFLGANCADEGSHAVVGNEPASSPTSILTSKAELPKNTATVNPTRTREPSIVPAKPDAKFGIGMVAPDFAINSTEGKTVKLSDFKGRPVVIVVWRDYVVNFSNTAVSKVIEAGQNAGGSDLVILVQANKNDKRLGEFAGKAIVLVDPNGIFESEYPLAAVPTTIEIDKKGVVANFRQGSGFATSDMTADITKLVAGVPVIERK